MDSSKQFTPLVIRELLSHDHTNCPVCHATLPRPTVKTEYGACANVWGWWKRYGRKCSNPDCVYEQGWSERTSAPQ